MKKIKLLLSAALVSASVLSINSINVNADTIENIPDINEEAELSSRVKTISLPCRHEGNSWSDKIEDSLIVEVLDEKVEYTEDHKAYQKWDIKGLREGITEITFDYVSWNGNYGRIDSSKSITYVVRVDKDLNVTVKEGKIPYGKIELLSDDPKEHEWDFNIKDKSMLRIKKYNDMSNNSEGKLQEKGQTETWSVKGLKEGTTEVTFYYLSTVGKWENIKSVTYVIDIDADLNVTITEKKTETDSKKISGIIKGNSTTGYEWEKSVKDESVAEVKEDQWISHDQTGTLCGAGQTEIWSVKGLKEGKTEVIFNESAPSGEIEKVVVYDIDVDKNLNVTVKEKEKADVKKESISFKIKPYERDVWTPEIKDSSIAEIGDEITVKLLRMYEGMKPIKIPSTSIWPVKGLKEGTTQVKFKEVSPSGKTEKIVIYNIDVDSDLNVKVKEVNEVTPSRGFIGLYGDSSTGYAWTYKINDHSVAEIMEEKSTADDQGRQTQKWSVKGLKKGTTEVTYYYLSNEKDKVAKSITYVINIDSDCNVTINEKESAKDFEKKSIVLHGNASTGYSWKYNVEDESVAEIEEKDWISDDPTGTEDGAGQTQIWHIKGLKEGTTQVKFKYSRPGEQKTDKSVIYNINVDSDLNVTVTEKKNEAEPKRGNISLEENYSAQDIWEYEFEDPSIAKVEKETSIPDSYDPDPAPGAGEITTWTIKGLKEGKTKMTFKHKSFDSYKNGEIITYNIDVDSDLNVKIDGRYCENLEKHLDIAVKTEESTEDQSNTINPVIYLKNNRINAIDLSGIDLKYYYKSEDDKDEIFQCYYSGTTDGPYENFTESVQGEIKKISPQFQRDNADRCLILRFKNSPMLMPGQSMTINACVHKDDWSLYDRTNDYSRRKGAILTD